MGDYLRAAYDQPRPRRSTRLWAALLDWCRPGDRSLHLPTHVTDPIRADVDRPLLIDRLAEMPPQATTFHIETKDQP